MAQPSDFNENFRHAYPNVWKAFSQLSEQCHEQGPLDEKSRRLVKVAIAVASGLEGATHSAVRHARDANISNEELEHVALLAITTIGYPSAMRALSWIRDGAQTSPSR
ncbi:MAG TPA: carboxymuconolactone decarboxylase family protein [Clostridia bacterium]|nr:carboxymuconolactone decarboxylase family protein [Clostridia bacterium]